MCFQISLERVVILVQVTAMLTAIESRTSIPLFGVTETFQDTIFLLHNSLIPRTSSATAHAIALRMAPKNPKDA